MNLDSREKFYEYTNFLKNYYEFLRSHFDSEDRLYQKDKDAVGIQIYNKINLKNSQMIIREDIAERIKNTILMVLSEEKETVFYHLYGQFGIGKKTLVKRVSNLLGKNL